jgi:hypothetical protein
MEDQNIIPNEEVSLGGLDLSAKKMRTIAQEEVALRLRNESNAIREEFILIFGLFASVLIFLTIEVQIFQRIQRFSYVVGISFLLLASLLCFSYALSCIIKEKNTWKEFNTPMTHIIVLLFSAAVFCFAWGAIIHPGVLKQ